MNPRITTKEKILKSARHIFSEKGYQRATTAEIANSAGISEGTIYRHFDSKEDLLMSCVTPVLEYLIDSADKNIPESDDLRDFVKKGFQMRLEMFENHYETFRILFNEIFFSQTMANKYFKFLMLQEEKINSILNNMADMGEVKRTRNSLLFGLGQVTGIWFYLNLRRWNILDGVEFSSESMNIDEDYFLEDLTDFFMYGISGNPNEK